MCLKSNQKNVNCCLPPDTSIHKLGLVFHLTKTRLHNSSPALKKRMLPSLWRSQPVFHKKRRVSLSKKLLFVVNCLTIHKKAYKLT